MPKAKTSHPVLLSGWLKNLPAKKYFRQDGNTLFCEACLKAYNFKKVSDLHQHIKSNAHCRAASRFDSKPERQLQLSEVPSVQRCKFLEELTEALVAADIPWAKLANPKLETFLETYTGKNIPDESTLRKGYLKPLYIKAIELIRQDIGPSPVWIGVDETIDAAGRAVANVLVGSLKKDKPTKPHLLMSRELEKTNNATITQLMLDSFVLLCPGENQAFVESKFVLFLTDGVPYMIKAGKNLKRTYEKLLHVTCLAHGVNRVGEEVRIHHPEADKFIATLKAVFRKSPNRIQKLKSMFPELPLPPKPVVTRWGTWLEAVEYYSEHYHKIKSVVLSFDPADAKCVENAQSLLANEEVMRQLSYISTNFGFLKIVLKQLQEPGMPIKDTLAILTKTSQKLNSTNGRIAIDINAKLISVIENNPDLKQVQAVSKILNGEDLSPMGTNQLQKFEPSRVSCLMYAPLTTVIPERSFSMNKTILRDNRRKMTMQNFEMYLISHFELCTPDVDEIYLD